MARLTYPKFQVPKLDGTNMSGGKLYTYIAGTSTNKASYSDVNFATENANPVILDSRGEADVYLSGSYKLILKDADDVEVWTEDSFSVDTTSQWLSAITATYVTTTTFTVATDLTTDYHTSRAIKCNDATTLYGYVSSSSYSSPNTTVTVVLDSGSLSGSLTSVELGILTETNDSLPNSVARRDEANTFTATQTFNGAAPFIFEGATDNDFETTLAITDPTADRTITVPDKTGTLILNDDVSKIESITAVAASNDLTVGINPTFLNFAASSLTNGVPVSRTLSSAITMVIPDGATLGAINGQLTRVYELAIDNAGTIEPAIVNAAGGVNLNEEGLISTTAISVASDSNDVIYSTTARSNVSYRVVGLVEFTQATAGTYATQPSLKRGMGGNALTSMSSLGYGQTWQLVTRTDGVTYYNTKEKPITLILYGRLATGAYSSITVTVNGVAVIVAAGSNDVSDTRAAGSIIIPPNISYVVDYGGFTTTNTAWELR